MAAPSPTRDEAAIRSARGELRFAPGGDLVDGRGGSWSVEGDLATIRAEVQDGRLLCTEYPDALAAHLVGAAAARPPATCCCRPRPGYEFVDWGGADHVGGGSHGSMHRSDSLGALLWCGTGPDSRIGARAMVAARRRADGPRAFRDRSLNRLWIEESRLGPG